MEPRIVALLALRFAVYVPLVSLLSVTVPDHERPSAEIVSTPPAVYSPTELWYSRVLPVSFPEMDSTAFDPVTTSEPSAWVSTSVAGNSPPAHQPVSQ